MRNYAIFLLLLIPTMAVAQEGEWRRVQMTAGEAQPERSVAAAPDVNIPDPIYETIDIDPSTMARTNSRRIEAEFLGERIPVQSEVLPQLGLARGITESKVTAAYRLLSQQPVPVLLSDLKHEADARRLNDWGYLQWVHAVTGTMYRSDPAARNLATAWIMQQSGYKATVSYSNRQINLLVATQQKLYGHSFLNVSGNRMYVVNPLGRAPEVQAAYLFEPVASRRGRALDMRISQAPNLSGTVVQRPMAFKYNGQRYRGSIAVNKRVAAFYYRYPLVDWSVYIAAPISREALASITTFLREPLSRVQPRRGWTRQMEQANVILHFIQGAFPYRSDGEAIGEEHYAFAEEMLALPYSDCEDRSALYVTLVRELLHLEAVGLLFPGHAAAGVNFGRNAPGASVTLGNSKFIVCDPSYIGADIGRVIPQVEGRSLTVIGR